MRRMQAVHHNIAEDLIRFGALPHQIVDVANSDSPRVLDYLDLRMMPDGICPPVVIENQGLPCVHVFDATVGGQDQVGPFCKRVALRGDGAWVGLWTPGSLRIFRADLTEKNEVRAESVAEISPGELVLPRFLYDVRSGVDDVARRRYLLELLAQSAQDAARYGLSQADALSLVGRGLFWRFLVDRTLLKGLHPQDVCETASTWEQCLDNKTRALKTFRWLDDTFNGGLLPFEVRPRDFPPELFASVLGNIAHGATETGQLRLPTDWREVNFAYVPVGLLSEVYEAFAHQMGVVDAKEKSIHYTPSHLVQFVVTQALEQLPASARPRVLDPAAGAGGFLVTALRKLVEREWRQTGHRPNRQRIRKILNEQLVGFDIDGRALRLAELALYLTALELDPHPAPLSQLRFLELRDRVLFDVSNVRSGSLGPIPATFQSQFDLVIGNPPWTAIAKGGADKKQWVKDTSRVVCERLGPTQAKTFDFPDTNPDLPFVWRAMEWAKPGGRIALIVHARWLFGLSPRATAARNAILSATRVTGILNGSALRLTKSWPAVDAPWCVLFATNEKPDPLSLAAFQFISPALFAAVDAQQTRFRIDWLDSQVVPVREVMEKPWSLKSRFRGNRLAGRALDRLISCGESLGDYLNRLGTGFRNGYQVGGKAGVQQDASALIGMPTTKGCDEPLGFVVNVKSLPRFDWSTLLFPRQRSIYEAPLLLVHESISGDRLVPRSCRAEADVAYHQSFHGISFASVPQADLIARYLQIWLQSQVMLFGELLLDGRYGSERDALYQESLELLPVVPIERLTAHQVERIHRLSHAMQTDFSTPLADEIDAFIFDTFGLSPAEREAIIDTLDTALPSAKSKHRAASPPTEADRRQFIAALRQSMKSAQSASDEQVTVTERRDVCWQPWRVLEVRLSAGDGRQPKAPPLTTFLEQADEGGASLVVVRDDPSTWFVGLLDQYAQWTKTRARLLATDLLVEQSR